jgi:hypothetical protein
MNISRFVYLNIYISTFIDIVYMYIHYISQDGTPKTGQAKQDRQNRTDRTGQTEQDRTDRTGQDRQNWADRTELHVPGKD